MIRLVDILKDKYGIDIKYERFFPRPKDEANDAEIQSMVNGFNLRNALTDCTTRAMVKALDLDYDQVMDEQLLLARKYRCGPYLDAIMHIMLSKRGWKFESSNTDMIKYTVMSYIVTYQASKCIMLTHEHAFAIIDWVIYDSMVMVEEYQPTFIDNILNDVCYGIFIPEESDSNA